MAGITLSKAVTAVQLIVKYAGLKSVGAILSSRKGVCGIAAIGLSYWLLLGRLPDGTSTELVAQMSETFGTIVSVVAALFIGGTALEDAFKQRDPFARDPSKQ